MRAQYEFVFPMVVGPRYIPGTVAVGQQQGGGWAPDTNQRSRCFAHHAPGRREGHARGHDISLEVALDAGVANPGTALRRRTPSMSIAERERGHHPTLRTTRPTIPNKDFILKYDVAGSRDR